MRLGLLLGLILVRESFFAMTAYFVMVPGATVYCDGKPVTGWLHRGGEGRFLLSPLAAIGDVNPPCPPFSFPASTQPHPPERAPIFSETSVTLTGDDGGRIQAAW